MFIVNRIDSACLGKLTSVENRTQVNPLHFSIDFCNSSMPNKKKVGILLQQKNRDRSMWCVSLYLQSSRTRCAPRGAQDAFLQQNNTEQQNAVFIVNRIDSACLGKLIIVETRTQVNPIHFSIDSCKLGMPRFFSYSGSTACFFIYNLLEKDARHMARMRATWRARCLSLHHNNTEQQNTVFIVGQIDLACLCRELIIVEARNQSNPYTFFNCFCLPCK